MTKSFLSCAISLMGPASASGMSAPSRLGRRLSQMPSAAPSSGSVAIRRGPHCQQPVAQPMRGDIVARKVAGGILGILARHLPEHDRQSRERGQREQPVLVQGSHRPLLGRARGALPAPGPTASAPGSKRCPSPGECEDMETAQQAVEPALRLHVGRLQVGRKATGQATAAGPSWSVPRTAEAARCPPVMALRGMAGMRCGPFTSSARFDCRIAVAARACARRRPSSASASCRHRRRA